MQFLPRIKQNTDAVVNITTGGSLGMTPDRAPPDAAFAAMQFDKAGFWWIALAAWAANITAASKAVCIARR